MLPGGLAGIVEDAFSRGFSRVWWDAMDDGAPQAMVFWQIEGWKGYWKLIFFGVPFSFFGRLHYFAGPWNVYEAH